MPRDPAGPPTPTTRFDLIRLAHRCAALLLAVCIGMTASAQSGGTGVPGAPGQPGTWTPPGALFGGADELQAVHGDSRDAATPSLVLSRTQMRAGDDFAIAVVFDIKREWHLWTQEGARPPEGVTGVAKFDSAIWTELDVPAAAGITTYPQFAQWPEAHIIEGDLAGDGVHKYLVFEGFAKVFVPATVQANTKPGKYTIRVLVTFQACKDVCLNPVFEHELTAEIEVVGAGDVIATADPDPVFGSFDSRIFGDIRGGTAVAPAVIKFDVFGWTFEIDAQGWGFVLLLLVAAIGGLLLNFTPCVLPVIPLKIMGLANSGGSRARTLLLGAVMSLGVIAFWAALGIAVTSINGFTSTNQLFQIPWVTMTLGVVIGIMAIGMMGAFAVGLPQWVYAINPKHDSLPGSFGFGIMTAVLATPCTAPLMGAAMAWATTQPMQTVLIVFTAVGTGMALPYLVLSACPSLLAKMPRTGPASELIKQVMGLLLLAAAAYFVGAGLSGFMRVEVDPPSRIYWWVVVAFSAAAGVWLLIRTIAITSHAGRRVVFGGIGVLIVAVSAFIGVEQTSKGPIAWTYYTESRLAEATTRGDVVVLEFTAEWCLNCKLLEATVLHAPEVASVLNGAGVAAIKVDITGNAKAGNKKLNDSGSVTIPFLVVLAPDGQPVFKGSEYTRQQIIDAVAAARGTANVSTSSSTASVTKVSGPPRDL